MSDSNLKRKLTQSAKDSIEYVWPSIKEKLGGGKLLNVESVFDDEMRVTLDYMGVDAWHLGEDGRGIRSLALRVQYPNPKWKTFAKYPYHTNTIRSKSVRFPGVEVELQKKMRAIITEPGRWDYPKITVHAYMSSAAGSRDQSVLACSIIKTDTLFHYVFENKENLYVQKPNGENHFIVVEWCELAEWLRQQGATVGNHIVFFDKSDSWAEAMLANFDASAWRVP